MAKASKKAATAAEPEVAITNKYAIEKGIAMPARQRFGGEAGPSPYPFDDMEVGDAFFIQVEVDASEYAADEQAKVIAEDQRKIANRLSGATRRFTKQNEGVKFGVRSAEKDGTKGVRVWRTA